MVYSTAVLGSHVHVHYCMNKFAGWSILESSSEKECDRCGMKNTKCCKIEIKENKAATEQNTSSSIATLLPWDLNHPIVFSSEYFFKTYTPLKVDITRPHAPPLLHENDMQSLYCIFLI